MEASALRAPALARRPLSTPLLRLRSDEQLVALFRAGSDDAFAAMHDRYRQRLFAYVRQMLSAGSRADAEDVLQDVFVRAYGALRCDTRDINLRAWLYRVAHNRCIDHLRRPTPPASDIFELSRTPLQDPIETAQRREDLKRLVEDVGRLPEQQRSALLMREIDGVTYADIALALDVTVPAVKSLLVRARIGLVEAIQARDTDCAVIREDLAAAFDRGVKATGRARRHMRECAGCREYKTALRTMRRSFAALSPVAGFGPLALLAKVLGVGGAGAGGGTAAVGGTAGAGLATSGAAAAAAAACKVAVVVCTAALATGGVAEVRQLTRQDAVPVQRSKQAAVTPALPLAAGAGPTIGPRMSARAAAVKADKTSTADKPVRTHDAKVPTAEAPAAAAPAAPTDPTGDTGGGATSAGTGGSSAPSEPANADPPSTKAPPAAPADAPATPSAGATAPQDATAAADPAGTGGTAPPGSPPPEH